MNTCPNCGKEDEGTWEVCPYCGFPLEEPPESENGTRDKRKKLILALFIILILLIAMPYFFLFVFY